MLCESIKYEIKQVLQKRSLYTRKLIFKTCLERMETVLLTKVAILALIIVQEQTALKYTQVNDIKKEH
jgi:hypothetical protein